jgi:hypothetical protein
MLDIALRVDGVGIVAMRVLTLPSTDPSVLV